MLLTDITFVLTLATRSEVVWPGCFSGRAFAGAEFLGLLDDWTGAFGARLLGARVKLALEADFLRPALEPALVLALEWWSSELWLAEWL